MIAANPAQTLESLQSLKVDKCKVTLLLASTIEEEGPPAYRRIIVSKDVGDDFKAIVEGAVSKYRKAKDDNDVVFQKYTDLSKLDAHEIEWLELAKNSSISDQLPDFKKLLEIPILGNDEDAFLAKLRFYIVVLHLPNGKEVSFFRNFSSQRELGRSAKMAFLLKKGHFDKFEEKVFLFDQKLDCVLVDGFLLIFQKNNFQKIFRFFELLGRVAESTLQKIKGSLPIENFDEFADACRGHQYMLAKLKNISDTLDFKKASIDNIKKVIKNFDLKVSVVGDTGNEKLQFDPKDKWAILKLLDDDYLKSDLTGSQYEVNSKRALG